MDPEMDVEPVPQGHKHCLRTAFKTCRVNNLFMAPGDRFQVQFAVNLLFI